MAETVTIGDKAINLDSVFPLTVGNWEDLEESGVVVGNELKAEGAKAMTTIALTLLRNAVPELMREDIRRLPISALSDIATRLTAAMSNSTAAEDKKPAMAGDPT